MIGQKTPQRNGGTITQNNINKPTKKSKQKIQRKQNERTKNRRTIILISIFGEEYDW